MEVGGPNLIHHIPFSHRATQLQLSAETHNNNSMLRALILSDSPKSFEVLHEVYMPSEDASDGDLANDNKWKAT